MNASSNNGSDTFQKMCKLRFQLQENFFCMTLLVFYLCLFFINVFLLHISGHSKVCHFARFSFSNQYITGSKISVDYLKQFSVVLLNEK